MKSSCIVSLLILVLLMTTMSVEAVGDEVPSTKLFRPRYFRYRRWDPTHDFYDDYEFTREVRRPFHPMAYRQRLQ